MTQLEQAQELEKRFDHNLMRLKRAIQSDNDKELSLAINDITHCVEQSNNMICASEKKRTIH